MVEKRRKTRVDFRTQVTVKADNEQIVVMNADSKDISMNGLFVVTGKKIEIGNDCDVEVALTGLAGQYAITVGIKGVVVRHSDEGFGIEFTSIDIASWNHLRNIILYNAEDPDKIEQEISSIKPM